MHKGLIISILGAVRLKGRCLTGSTPSLSPKGLKYGAEREWLIGCGDDYIP